MQHTYASTHHNRELKENQVKRVESMRFTEVTSRNTGKQLLTGAQGTQLSWSSKRAWDTAYEYRTTGAHWTPAGISTSKKASYLGRSFCQTLLKQGFLELSILNPVSFRDFLKLFGGVYFLLKSAPFQEGSLQSPVNCYITVHSTGFCILYSYWSIECFTV